MKKKKRLTRKPSLSLPPPTPYDQFVLTVSDNGIGLPRGIQIHRCQLPGLKLISVLVKQIKGAIRLGEKGRTEFVITFEAKK